MVRETGTGLHAAVYVDDATSRLMMLHFTQTESTFSYFELEPPDRTQCRPAAVLTFP